MPKDLDLWNFIAARLRRGESVMLLVVAESTGSSPGRAGYKMAVAADGELCGSIGGGVMEVRLVEHAKSMLSEPGAIATGFPATILMEQVHQKNAVNRSGMICSGRQTVLFKTLTSADANTVNTIVESHLPSKPVTFEISNLKFQIVENSANNSQKYFSRSSQTDFVYQERLGSANNLYIIGGGHCALALSELISRLDFHIRIFDDRPELNTLDKNDFADEVTILDGYEELSENVESDEDTYLVVMTLGYASDAVVIRQLVGRDFKYFGVLGSKAKMATLMKELLAEGIDEQRLARIRTPIGLPINSRTPEEIAISIAAEIIAVKNEANG